MILDFAAGRTSFEEMYMTGKCYDAELVYYPSSFPQRTLVKQIFTITTPASNDHHHGHTLPGYESATGMLADYARALGSNPWVERIPFILHNVIVAQHANGWMLYDAESRMLPIKLTGKDVSHLWGLLAQSGGHPITVIGEWDGYEANLLEMVP